MGGWEEREGCLIKIRLIYLFNFTLLKTILKQGVKLILHVELGCQGCFFSHQNLGNMRCCLVLSCFPASLHWEELSLCQMICPLCKLHILSSLEVDELTAPTSSPVQAHFTLATGNEESIRLYFLLDSHLILA